LRLIPNSFVVPSSKSKLFCPQHWAQEARDNTPELSGTVCITDDKQVIFMWSHKKYSKTVPLDPKAKVAIMYTAPGYDLSESKITQIEASMVCHNVILANEIGLVSDNKSEPAKSTQDANDYIPDQTADLDNTPHLIKDFNLNRPADQQVDIDEEDRVQGTPESDLLCWHH